MHCTLLLEHFPKMHLKCTLKHPTQITSQRLLDESQAGVCRGKRHIPPHFGLFWAIRIPYPKGLNCLFNPLSNHYFVQ